MHTTPVNILKYVATITDQRDRNLLAKTLTTTLTELTHSKRITIYRILPTDQGMKAVMMAQTCNEEFDSAIHQEVSIVIADRADFQEVLDSGKSSIQALDNETNCAIYPITDKLHIVGLLEIISHPHNEVDTHLISAFLLVYSNYLTLLNESETDTLTGLLNRRTFENNLERIIAECSADDETQSDPPHPARRNCSPELPHWLAVMDIDHFKRINDEFGHLYGDEVLLLLSRNMKRVFRQSDKLFRFGGEEFIVVLDRTDLESAKNVLERFRDAIENYHFPQVGKVTISIGFVRLDKADGTSSIVGRADQALYYAKDHGRNMVCFYDDLVAEGKLAAEHFSDDMELF
jgi:diguanylate cyclase (GGDEF)-like protein